MYGKSPLEKYELQCTHDHEVHEYPHNFLL